jgi:uncharacterized metal-binding protein YceD (DUF177 family)
MVSPPEFSDVVKLDEIGAGTLSRQLSADAGERDALAARFALCGLDRLEADLSVLRDAKGILANGRIKARLSQFCVVTGDPVPVDLDEPMTVRFITEPTVAPGSEIELEPGDCDTMFHDGHGVDLGEAVAQTLGLALDPYPRSPTADKRLQAAGVKTEDDVLPAGAFSGLKDLLAKK